MPYNERIINIEHGSFVPLIFSITGGMGRMAETFYKLLCNKISMKSGDIYSNVINVFRCKLSYLICRMTLLCVRGSRSIRQKDNNILHLGNDCGFISNEANI